jgi:hypothetical protein
MDIISEIAQILKDSIANGDSCIPEAALAARPAHLWFCQMVY